MNRLHSGLTIVALAAGFALLLFLAAGNASRVQATTPLQPGEIWLRIFNPPRYACVGKPITISFAVGQKGTLSVLAPLVLSGTVRGAASLGDLSDHEWRWMPEDVVDIFDVTYTPTQEGDASMAFEFAYGSQTKTTKTPPFHVYDCQYHIHIELERTVTMQIVPPYKNIVNLEGDGDFAVLPGGWWESVKAAVGMPEFPVYGEGKYTGKYSTFVGGGSCSYAFLSPATGSADFKVTGTYDADAGALHLNFDFDSANLVGGAIVRHGACTGDRDIQFPITFDMSPGPPPSYNPVIPNDVAFNSILDTQHRDGCDAHEHSASEPCTKTVTYTVTKRSK